MQELENPYAAPKAVLENLNGVDDIMEVSGKLIIVGRNAELPECCYVTGEPITTEKRRAKKLHYTNPYLALLILLGIIGIILYVVISASNKKSVVVKYNLSKEGKKNLNKKRLFGSLLCLLFLIGGVFCFAQADQEIVPFGFLGIMFSIVTLIVTISIGTVMRVRKYKNGLFYLSGSGQKFRDYLMRHQPSSTINSQVRY